LGRDETSGPIKKQQVKKPQVIPLRGGVTLGRKGGPTKRKKKGGGGGFEVMILGEYIGHHLVADKTKVILSEEKLGLDQKMRRE